MNVLYVASEVAPFAVSGGLADVMGALPKAIASDANSGISPSVILPLYGTISEKWRSQMERIDEFTSKYLIGPTFFSDEMRNDGPKFE